MVERGTETRMQKTGISKQEQRIRRRIRRWIGRGWRLLRLALLLIVLLLLLSDGISVDRTLRGRAVALVRDHLYDYVGWEADALWASCARNCSACIPIWMKPGAKRWCMTT